MDSETEKIIKAVTTAGILGTLAAAIRALLVNNESAWQRLRTFFAGVLMSVFLGYVLMNSAVGEMYKALIYGGAAAFISTIWPLLERIAKRWVLKKGNDVVSGTDNGKHNRK